MVTALLWCFAWGIDYETEIFMLKIYKKLPLGLTSVEE